MVVVTIIGVIAVIAVPQFVQQSDKAKVKAALGDLRSIKGVIDLHIAENGDLPVAAESSSQDSIDQLGEVLGEAGIDWSSIHDPWGNGYRYSVNGDDYTIDSAGPDGVFGDGSDDLVASKDSHPESNQGGTAESAGDFLSGS